MEGDNLCVFERCVFDESSDVFGLGLCGRRHRQRRNGGGVDSQNSDKVDVIFHAMKIPLFGLSGKPYVIDQAFVFCSVADLEPGSGKERQERGSRPSVKIDDHIGGLSPYVANMFPEFFESQVSREDEHSIQIGMTFYEFPIRLIDDIGDLRFGETLSERSDGGRCHNDIADPSEPDQKDALNPGWINLSFLSLAQWSPHR